MKEKVENENRTGLGEAPSVGRKARSVAGQPLLSAEPDGDTGRSAFDEFHRELLTLKYEIWCLLYDVYYYVMKKVTGRHYHIAYDISNGIMIRLYSYTNRKGITVIYKEKVIKID